jgi:hypothetical protein
MQLWLALQFYNFIAILQNGQSFPFLPVGKGNFFFFKKQHLKTNKIKGQWKINIMYKSDINVQIHPDALPNGAHFPSTGKFIVINSLLCTEVGREKHGGLGRGTESGRWGVFREMSPQELFRWVDVWSNAHLDRGSTGLTLGVHVWCRRLRIVFWY